MARRAPVQNYALRPSCVRVLSMCVLCEAEKRLLGTFVFNANANNWVVGG